MQKTYQLILMVVLLAIVLAFSWSRDSGIERAYTVDLRNRIVGARLQMDGKSPYFYRWKPNDGIRYYDPIKFDTTYASAITASPFFHDLLFPIANLPQREISRIWLVIEYLSFVGCLLLGFSFAKNANQRWLVLIFALLILFSEPWKASIKYGQIYLVFPFFCFAFIFCFDRRKQVVFCFFAGLIAAMTVLSRPTLILFFVPFLFFIKGFSTKGAFVFLLPIILLFGYNFLNSQQRTYWIDYVKGIKAHIKHHQSQDVDARNAAYSPIIYPQWEGWNQDSINSDQNKILTKFHLQFSGIQWSADKIFNLKISARMLNFCCAVVILFLIILFGFRIWKTPDLSIVAAAIFGFCLYMLTDFFSPIHRTNYYAVQWIFPILLAGAFYERRSMFLHILLFAGLLLNVLNIPFIKMQYTLGEYLILIGLLILCFDKKWELIK